jgi:hypothetical protein
MSEDTVQCSVCGADLEGSDVYEGICHKCREDRVLGSRPSVRKPARPAPPPPAKPSPAPPPPTRIGAAPDVIALETDVDTDADTREMLELKEAAAEAAAAEAPPSVPESGAEATRSAEPPNPFDRVLCLDEPAEATPAGAESAEPPTDVASPAAAPAGAKPLKAEAPPAPEPQAGPELPVLRLRAEPDHPAYGAAVKPAPPPPAPRPAPEREEPILLRPRADERPAESGLAAEPSLRLREEQTADSAELRALLERLAHDVEEVSARLRGSAGLTMTPRQQVGFGFRAFFGFLLGAGLLALAAIGILGLAGYLFNYAPALAIPKRLLSWILGTP